MIKAEFSKIFKEGFFYFIFISTILTISFCSVSYISKSKESEYKFFGYQISKYSTKEDIKNLMEDVNKDLNDASLSNMQLKSRLLVSYNIYKYLYNEEFISYEELVDYKGINFELDSNQFSFLRYNTTILKIVLTIILGIWASLIVIMDFNRGTYKFVYSRSKSRIKIIITKFIIWNIVTIILVILSVSSVTFIGIINDDSNITNIIFANDSIAFSLNYVEFFLFELINLLLYVLTYGYLIFFLSLFFKNILITLSLNLIFIGLTYVLNSINNPFFTCLTQGFSSIFEYDNCHNVFILYIFSIIFLILGNSVIFSLKNFKRKDLIY